MATLTRQEAVAEMVDGAIGAWFDGRHACAITLAGAAETGMPTMNNGASTFAALRYAMMKFGKCSEKDAADLMNTSRNWLKHFRDDKPEIISTDYAWAYVLRAYLQYNAVYQQTGITPNMQRFQARIDEHTQPVREAIYAFTSWMHRMMENITKTIAQPKQ